MNDYLIAVLLIFIFLVFLLGLYFVDVRKQNAEFIQCLEISEEKDICREILN